MSLLSRESLAQAGERINAFLHDEIVQEALRALERKYLNEFKAADSSEKRVTSWAQFRLLDDFTTALTSVVTAGDHAAHDLLRIAKVEEARKAGRPLPHE